MQQLILELKSSWGSSSYGIHKGAETGLRMACSFHPDGAKWTFDDGYAVPSQLEAFWSAAKEAKLFEDVDYGQWGLHILSPEDALKKTEAALKERPHDFLDSDLVIGQFLGDSDLLVISREKGPSFGHVLIALPIDPRNDWYHLAVDFPTFLEQYVASKGDKFWEP